MQQTGYSDGIVIASPSASERVAIQGERRAPFDLWIASHALAMTKMVRPNRSTLYP
jgi:hypothetical protein